MRTCISITLLSVLALAVFTGPAMADDPKARAIMEKVDAREDGDRSVSDMRMVLINKQGKERVRSLRSYGMDRGDDHFSLMFFLAPADVAATGFLTHDYDTPEKEDDQWLYLPALNKTKRIAAGDKSGSFMGSDFSYSDLTSRRLEDYDYAFHDKQPETEVYGKKVWVINVLPRGEKTSRETGYKRTIAFVRQDNHVIIRAIYFPRNANTTKYYDVKKLELIDGIWTDTEIHMTTKKGKQTVHKTILTFDNVKYNQDSVNENFFTIRRLEKGP
ncbi:MAG: outer membrane lipoprotein-sorting protein [Thermodesulfobacteriota bacterium]